MFPSILLSILINFSMRVLNSLRVLVSFMPASEGRNTHTDTDADSDEDESLTPDEARLIKFARFVNGYLKLFEATTDELDYIAFSHVWGKWEWRRVPGIPYEVKASQEKADFIANDLPALVGDGAFWMDTITVDQRDDRQVRVVVDAIPTIFRMAKRTIAVLESDGLYDCCMKAVEGFEDYYNFRARLTNYCDEYIKYMRAESYL